jgi:hypothetical protein
MTNPSNQLKRQHQTNQLNRVLLFIVCAAVSFATLPVFTLQAADKGEDVGAVKVKSEVDQATRVRKIETTQSGDAKKLGKVAGDVAWLLRDLESNGLLEQVGGKKVKTLKEVVAIVADTHLPAAAQHLRNARLEPDASRHHMVSADEEVDTILTQLAKVLADSSTMLVQDELAKELKDLIKVQTQVRGQTAEWGKSMLISPETAGAGKGPLMQDQTMINTRYQTFLEKLQQAHEDALDEASKSRLKQVENVLSPPQTTSEILKDVLTPEPSTGDVLKAAVEQLEQSQVLDAVGAQDRAIATFKAALEILSAGQSDLADFVAGLEKLLEKQKALRKEIEPQEEEDFKSKLSFFEARQVEIMDEVTNFTFDAPDLFVNKKGEYLVEPLLIALSDAVESISATEKEKTLIAQAKVIVLLESVYGTAKETLEEEEGDPFWAASPFIPEDKWKLPKDGDEEDEALKDEDFPEIFEGIIAAELMIQPDSVAQGAQEDVSTALAAPRMVNLKESEDEEPPDFITDEGPPTIGSDKDAPDAAGEDTKGDTSEVEKDRLARESIQRKRQKAKIQDYVRQLPPEFRRQVADYYEVIAE